MFFLNISPRISSKRTTRQASDQAWKDNHKSIVNPNIPFLEVYCYVAVIYVLLLEWDIYLTSQRTISSPNVHWSIIFYVIRADLFTPVITNYGSVKVLFISFMECA